jgi:hypothetical protein
MHVNKFSFLRNRETGAPPGAVNPALFMENRQCWSEKKDKGATYRCC